MKYQMIQPILCYLIRPLGLALIMAKSTPMLLMSILN
jgi:hypothetical protein